MSGNLVRSSSQQRKSWPVNCWTHLRPRHQNHSRSRQTISSRGFEAFFNF